MLNAIISGAIGIFGALGGTLIQGYISKKNAEASFLFQRRQRVYARLLFLLRQHRPLNDIFWREASFRTHTVSDPSWNPLRASQELYERHYEKLETVMSEAILLSDGALRVMLIKATHAAGENENWDAEFNMNKMKAIQEIEVLMREQLGIQ